MSLDVQHALKYLPKALTWLFFPPVYRVAKVVDIQNHSWERVSEVCTVEVARGIWRSSLECKGLHLVLKHEVCSWQRLLGKVQAWQKS